MRTSADTSDEIIAEVLSHLPGTVDVDAKATLATFVQAYYQQLDQADLITFATEDLFGAAVSHWELLQKRLPGDTKIRIYNPQIQHNGWQSGHTIIELVSEDMPYLVSSLSMVITQLGVNIHLTNHPVMNIQRDSNGILSNSSTLAADESIIHLEIDRITDDEEITHLCGLILDTVSSIRIAVEDDDEMRDVLQALHRSLSEHCGQSTHYDKSIDVLEWLDDKNLSLLGLCSLTREGEGDLQISPNKALGILSNDSEQRGFELDRLIPAQAPVDLIADDVRIRKINVRSPVIRSEYLDIITIPWPDNPATEKQCKLKRQKNILCIVGLFSPSLKFANTASIPLLRDKTHTVMKNSGVNENSHAGRSLRQTLELFPRDMLFQTDTDTLLSMASGIVNLQERQHIKLFGSMSRDGLYCNCLVYIPRETYGRELRLAIEFILLKDLDGISSEFESRFSSESSLARIHYVVQLASPRTECPAWLTIEKHIVQAAISWENQLLGALLQHFDEERANSLHRLYRDAFPSSYKEAFSARAAQSDITTIEDQAPTDRPIIRFYHNLLTDDNIANFKLYSPGAAIALSDIIPIIENLGMRVEGEHPYPIRRHHQTEGWIHEFSVQHLEGKTINAQCSWKNLQAAFEKIWCGQVENDGFNRLILAASLIGVRS